MLAYVSIAPFRVPIPPFRYRDVGISRVENNQYWIMVEVATSQSRYRVGIRMDALSLTSLPRWVERLAHYIPALPL
jgi:hypothetical protein